jgi:hypothetical protein
LRLLAVEPGANERGERLIWRQDAMADRRQVPSAAVDLSGATFTEREMLLDGGSRVPQQVRRREGLPLPLDADPGFSQRNEPSFGRPLCVDEDQEKR